MPNSSTNPLLKTSDRYYQARAIAWLENPPPCRENPATLPCDCEGTVCPLGIDKKSCKYRLSIVKAIKKLLALSS